MLKNISVLILAIGILWVWLQPKEGQTVKTANGWIKGTKSTSRDGREFFQWLGIPYAEPPLGKLRFASPQPVKKWEGIRSATSYGSHCAQVEMLFNTIIGDEDCLHLNVFAPNIESLRKNEGLPVMVYIHGGGFSHMSAWDHQPHYLMDEDVVVVTLNYRLGFLGFASTGDATVRGNMGLKDQHFALRWVKDNIQAFGGNPNKITIFGESAGGASVALQLLYPRNKDIVKKAISQSGVSTNPFAIEKNSDTKRRTQELAASVNCPTNNAELMTDCLRDKSMVELVEATIPDCASHRMLHPHKSGIFFHPTIEPLADDEAFITKHPAELVKTGEMLRVPWITGVVADEGITASSAYHIHPEQMQETESNWHENTMNAFGLDPLHPQGKSVTEKIKTFYFPPNQQMDFTAKMEQYQKMYSDSYYNFHTSSVAEMQRQYADVYLYYFSREGGPSLTPVILGIQTVQGHSGIVKALIALRMLLQTSFINFVYRIPPEELGICHGDELPMLFYIPLVYKFSRDEQANVRFSKDMVRLWVSFAYDKPMTFRGVEFRQTSPTGTLQYLELTETPSMIDEPFRERMEFLKSLDILNLTHM